MRDSKSTPASRSGALRVEFLKAKSISAEVVGVSREETQ